MRLSLVEAFLLHLHQVSLEGLPLPGETREEPT